MNKKIVYTTQWIAIDNEKEYPHGWGFDAPIVEFSQDEDPAAVAKICREKLSNEEFECIGAIPKECLLFVSSPSPITVDIVEALEKANPYPQEEDELPWLISPKTAWKNCCNELRELIASQPPAPTVQGLKYFIEHMETHKWLSIENLYPYPTYPKDTSEDIWTIDPNLAVQFNTRQEAEQHRKEYFDYPVYKVTEHLFMDQTPFNTEGQEERQSIESLTEKLLLAYVQDNEGVFTIIEEKSFCEWLLSKYTLIKK